jgi:hypothetical protein
MQSLCKVITQSLGGADYGGDCRDVRMSPMNPERNSQFGNHRWQGGGQNRVKPLLEHHCPGFRGRLAKRKSQMESRQYGRFQRLPDSFPAAAAILSAARRAKVRPPSRMFDRVLSLRGR